MAAAPRPIELYIPEIRQFIQRKDLDDLKELLSGINPIDLADGFDAFPPEQQLLILRLLDAERAVEVFEELDLSQQEYLIEHLGDTTLAPLVEGIPQETTARLFNKLPERFVKKMSSLMKHEKVLQVRDAMRYPERTAGSLMQAEAVPVQPEMSARTALERLQACARVRKGGFIHSLYVTGEGGRLIGGVTLRTLIGAPADIKVRDIMAPVSLIRIPAKMDREEAAQIFAKYKLISAPVVDEENRLVGVLTVDDMLNVIQEENTEDIAKLAGTRAEELETGSFLRVSTLRMPWLLASYGGGILVSFIIGHFEGLLGRMAAMAAFMPVIAGMGGNVGTQSSTIVVRGLSTGRIRTGELFRVIRREFAVGLTLGAIYGVMLGCIAWWQNPGMAALELPLVVGAGILTSMTVAATMGTATPFLFSKLGIDPAAVSAPFVSTSTDIVSILAYFSLGAWLLS